MPTPKDHKRLQQLENEIAASRKALLALKREKRFAEKVLDSLPGIFYLYDDKGQIIRWNKNHETLTGFSAAELPRRKMFDWFSDTDKPRVAGVVRHIYATGKRSNIEAELIIKSGARIPYYFTGVRMTVDRRKYLLGVGIDLTEQKQIEDALRKSEEKYRAIFEYAVEGIYQTTPDGQLVSANPAMARMLGYDSVAQLLAAVQDVSRDLYVSHAARKQFIQKLRRNQIVSGYEVEFYRRDGGTIWIALNARPLTDTHGELRLIEGIIHDVTDRKRQADALQAENLRLRANIKDRFRFGNIIGKSAAMQEIYELIVKASVSEANVIIYGESGTGKELVARAIHDLGHRRQGRFIPVNCGAIPENLLESEFFGYKKGAFTGATTDREGYLDLANGGTLFLDEIGEIGPSLQVKLLRVLEGGGYTPVGGREIRRPDLRIIAATNRDLSVQVARGLMREDFFYRIQIIPIHLPPLRDRREDIPLLIEHFLKQTDEAQNVPPLSGAMLEAMLHHDWPGNVRELQNVLHRYRSLNRFDLLPKGCAMPRAAAQRSDGPEVDGTEPFATLMDRYARAVLLKSLEAHRWHRENAARSLELPLRTFYRKLQKHGLIRQE
jgi:PAS domain S-box-containing protein